MKNSLLLATALIFVVLISGCTSTTGQSIAQQLDNQATTTIPSTAAALPTANPTSTTTTSSTTTTTTLPPTTTSTSTTTSSSTTTTVPPTTTTSTTTTTTVAIKKTAEISYKPIVINNNTLLTEAPGLLSFMNVVLCIYNENCTYTFLKITVTINNKDYDSITVTPLYFTANVNNIGYPPNDYTLYLADGLRTVNVLKGGTLSGSLMYLIPKSSDITSLSMIYSGFCDDYKECNIVWSKA